MYTNPNSRLFLMGIKNGTTERELVNQFQSFGAVQVHVYVPGAQNNGWAWIGFENQKGADEMLTTMSAPSSREVSKS